MSRRSCARSAILVVAVCVALAWAVPARSASGEEGTSKTFTIGAIDAQHRILTLKDSSGSVETIAVSPAVQKFGDLKVGDRVSVRYFEPMLLGVRPTGQPAPEASGSAASPTEVVATVAVTAIDPKLPSLSVKTDDGQALTFQVGDKKVIETLKTGDKVDITYMRPLATKVEKK